MKTVIPAKAGTHFDFAYARQMRRLAVTKIKMGSGFRRNDGVWGAGCTAPTEPAAPAALAAPAAPAELAELAELA
ncbi:hypothetical protein ACI2IY_01005 [Lysobacter enzymogenes]|uniref:hypothetical protein n=1 Tax=Lysobacter enzymogenes TaxID=69 RepID=UPI00384E7F59